MCVCVCVCVCITARHSYGKKNKTVMATASSHHSVEDILVSLLLSRDAADVTRQNTDRWQENCLKIYKLTFSCIFFSSFFLVVEGLGGGWRGVPFFSLSFCSSVAVYLSIKYITFP